MLVCVVVRFVLDRCKLPAAGRAGPGNALYTIDIIVLRDICLCSDHLIC